MPMVVQWIRATTEEPTEEPTVATTVSTVTTQVSFANALTDPEQTTAKASYKTRLESTYTGSTFGTVTMTPTRRSFLPTENTQRRGFLPNEHSLTQTSLNPIEHRSGARRTVSYSMAASASVPTANLAAFESTDVSTFAAALVTALQTDIPGVTATVATSTVASATSAESSSDTNVVLIAVLVAAAVVVIGAVGAIVYFATKVHRP